MFCDADCTYAMCGDGYHNMLSEQCDDGNAANDDACVGACSINVCGDGAVWQGVEQCDDDNMIDIDECKNDCTMAVCGDGVVWEDMETCDDQNVVDTDECSNACQTASCGDGILWEGNETCDDGNLLDNDQCPGSCNPAFCGDGYTLQNAEECDDGNQVDDDGCTNDCISMLWWVAGPQTNVPVDQLDGWTLCWSGTYDTLEQGLTNTILGQQCTGSKLLEACRPVGANVFTVLAMGDRADVLFDVGDGAASKHEANGVAWYFHDGYSSMGFARAGDTVSRTSCDTNNVNAEDRLCWHTGLDQIDGGWRCGTATNLNADPQWERLLYQAL
jgi:cysteine-rich repeat protein